MPWNDRIFNSKKRFIVLAKGRRVGGTQSALYNMIERMILTKCRVLWVDTVQSNLSRYVERFVIPALKQLPHGTWTWREQQKILTINQSYCDFRSAERPENLEGFGYNVIYVNEAGIVLHDRSLWNNTLRPMALDYKALCYFIGTPKGSRDKTGEEHLFKTMYDRGTIYSAEFPDWVGYTLSTYDNPLLDREEIKAMEAEVPAAIRAQEIFGQFVDVSAQSIFKDEWWQYTDVLPDPPNIRCRALSLDTSYGKNTHSDFSACTEWIQTYDGRWIITDCWQDRLDFPALCARVKQLWERGRHDVVIVEDKASGQSLIQALKQTAMPILPYKPDQDKIARATAITPIIETGKVALLKGPWNPMLVGQCSLFPQAEFDDIVDTVSQALAYLKPLPDFHNRTITHRRVLLHTHSAELRGY